MRFPLPFALFLTLIVFLPACSDDEPEEIASVEYIEWTASGDDVAPLFRAFPLEIDSIYLRIRVNVPNILAPDSVLYRMYIEKYKQGSNQPDIITGKDQAIWGARFDRVLTEPDSIVSFITTNAVFNDNDRTLIGIYKEFDDEDPLTMKFEYVYDDGNWPDPPNAEDGFGSTEDFEYGNNNVHTFRLYVYEDDTIRK